MKLIKCGAAILNQTPLDWDNNKANILAVIKEAKANGVSILCLPELAISGYGCEDAFYSAGLRRMARQVLAEILPETKGIIITLGLPVLHRNSLFNTVCLVSDGEIKGFVAKRFLAREGLHYEPRWFRPWPEGDIETVNYEGKDYPIGDIIFNVNGAKLGFEICEDAWVAKRPGGNLYSQGIDIIMNPSASHFAFGKHEVRQRFVLEGSRAFGVSYIYSNLVGNEAGRAIYDGGALIASNGELIASGPRFIFNNHHLTTAVVDIDESRMAQAKSGSNYEASGNNHNVIDVSFEFPIQKPEKQDLCIAVWENSDCKKEEEFTRAIALGLFDYMRKSRSQGFIVSLSGGADSSAVAVLVALMLKFAVKQLGIEGFITKAGLKNIIRDKLLLSLLTCVYQATENSSKTTLNAAETLARDLGAEFMAFDVNDLVKGYIKIVEESFGRPLVWETDDIALQNIQARVRAPGVWMLANLKNALLLSTSNRSEAAVGYATMDGDTCGGLSPIAGIDKAFLRQWLRWMETDGPLGFEPVESLKYVNRQIPTAELRPHEAAQTDEDDLMPYDLLDACECAAIRDKMTPQEVLEVVSVKFDQFSRDQIKIWVERFFTLWCRNQWKRERYAPSFHVDDKNLDPKTWCRFPILSGGYSRELKEMQ